MSLKAIGVTLDRQLVVAGVYKEFETHGTPLDLLIILLAEQKITPCWISLYRDAHAAGMKHSRIISKLEPAIADAFGEAYSKEVVSRLEKLSQLGHPALNLQTKWPPTR